MHICDVCYAEIEDNCDICQRCSQRKSPEKLMEENVPDEEITERYKELMLLRAENIEFLTDKLRSMSVKYDVL